MNEASRMVASNYQDLLQRFGFKFSLSGAHTSRTIMLEELTTLISHVNSSEATREDYLRAIEHDNCLGKRSGKTRTLTYRHSYTKLRVLERVSRLV